MKVAVARYRVGHVCSVRPPKVLASRQQDTVRFTHVGLIVSRWYPSTAKSCRGREQRRTEGVSQNVLSGMTPWRYGMDCDVCYQMTSGNLTVASARTLVNAFDGVCSEGRKGLKRGCGNQNA